MVQYTITEPEINSELDALFRDIFASETFEVYSAKLDLGNRVKNDPFRDVPYDVLHYLFAFLPGKSLVALIRASWPVNCATRRNNIWKLVIQWEMPWFWELWLQYGMLGEYRHLVNLKGLYLWLDKVTTPEYGMSGPFMGIANRRRIWGACQQIAGAYFKRVSQKKIWGNDEGNNAIMKNAIMKQSKVHQMPMVLYPQPVVVESFTTQWVYSWREVDYWPAAFETFWNAVNDLVGLAVFIGGDRRFFGRVAPNATGIHVKRQEIAGNEWISRLVLGLCTAGDLWMSVKDLSVRASRIYLRHRYGIFVGLDRLLREC